MLRTRTAITPSTQPFQNLVNDILTAGDLADLKELYTAAMKSHQEGQGRPARSRRLTSTCATTSAKRS